MLLDLQSQEESIAADTLEVDAMLQEEAEEEGTKKIEDEDGVDETLQLSLSQLP